MFRALKNITEDSQTQKPTSVQKHGQIVKDS